MSNDLVEFLRARLREDEATARAVVWDGSGNSLSWGLAASATVEVGNDEFNTDDRTVANHIVNHDPARALRDVEAKRRVIDECSYWADKVDQAADDASAIPYPSLADRYEVTYPILRALGTAYGDHPDYREEWRP